MIFLTPEQQAVVEYRLSIGYDYQLLPNGDYKLWKGRHIMIVNCLGYDCYVPSWQVY
jgi:hypothetical protein